MGLTEPRMLRLEKIVEELFFAWSGQKQQSALKVAVTKIWPNSYKIEAKSESDNIRGWE